ncbi:MAG: DUF2961 domain-containing protein [Tannerellaceae bacterium]|nr:DUF2961 domain-containing protein [Tannerellaceae bacterium]
MIPFGFSNKYIVVFALLIVGCGLLPSCSERKDVVGLPALLDEMMSVEGAAMYPAIPYRSHSVSGRIEGVLFDQKGPGVITRLRLAAGNSRGVMRFYFDGASSAEITLPVADLSQLNLPEADGGLITAGGSALYLPVPYGEKCRITFEGAPVDGEASDGYYQINYRRYPADVHIETFSTQRLERERKHIARVNRWLLEPDTATAGGNLMRGEAWLEGGEPLVVKLPEGENAVYRIEATATVAGKGNYAQSMRDIILQAIFDGKVTARVPVSDLSGGGMGAPHVESRYLSADGRGGIVSRWLMPYREKASLAFINEGRAMVHVSYSVLVSRLAWEEDRTLYFHASWKEETGLGFSSGEKEWNFAAISGGKGVYKGDVLSVYGHTGSIHASAVEIRVDGDDAPSYTETAVGEYYNAGLSPTDSFHTPFGGAPRAAAKGSHGYNTLLRTRILDDIPFSGRLSFDLRLADEKGGAADYAVTTFWYGDKKARPEKTSRPETWGRTLPPAPLE